MKNTVNNLILYSDHQRTSFAGGAPSTPPFKLNGTKFPDLCFNHERRALIPISTSLSPNLGDAHLFLAVLPSRE